MSQLSESILKIIAEYAVYSIAEKRNEESKKTQQDFENYLDSWSFRVGMTINKIKGQIGLPTDPHYAIHILEKNLDKVNWRFFFKKGDWTTFSKEDADKLKNILMKYI